ncbi:MAG: hypothetical protein ACOCM8_11365, partial [Acetivibrio ethanolgignens]
IREKKGAESKHKVGVCMSLGMCFGILAGVVFGNISIGLFCRNSQIACTSLVRILLLCER